jgi:hypothetical protein
MSIFRTSILCIGAVVALFGLASPASAQASRTWVSGVGDDANPCSRTAPCKTFAGAISKTAAGGEIDCLDEGGFGAVTITKGITLDCSGTFGSVLVSGTNGIVVSAGPADRVILRGIAINGIGSGINGIRFLAGAQLTVEKCAIYGFTTNGIDIALGAAGKAFVTNTLITNVGGDGIRAATTAGTLQVQVAGTVIEAPGQHGFESAGGTVVTAITNTVIGTAGASGVIGSGSGAQINVDTSTVDNSTIAFNAAVSGAVIRVANNAIYNNGINFNIVAGGTIASAGNNRITAAGGSAPNATLSVQ